MAQLSLFDSSDVVIDEARGRFIYTPGFIDPSLASRWLGELRARVAWRTQKRMMYDREVDVPRLLGHFRLDPPDVSVPRAIVEAHERVVAHLAVPFNSVGLNLYRDGRDSVAPHNDHLDEIVAGFPIALLSLGARIMILRQKEPPRRATQIALEPGSLFVMDYATQLHYTHGIPKTNEVVGERISLAFRVKPPRHGSESMSRRSAELRIFARDRRGRSCVLPSSQWNTDAKTLGNPRVRGWQPRCTTRAHADQGLRRHAN